MAKYENYFGDFGLRCFDSIDLTQPLDLTKRGVITELLCVISAALTIPHERLRPLYGPDRRLLIDHSHHPRGDIFTYAGAADDYAVVLQQQFGTTLGEGGDWHEGQGTLVWGEPGNWIFDAEVDLNSSKQSGGILRIIRNALAHGNVDVLGANGHEARIRFIGIQGSFRRKDDRKKGNSRKIDCVTVSIIDFSKFMVKWKELLTKLESLAKTA